MKKAILICIMFVVLQLVVGVVGSAVAAALMTATTGHVPTAEELGQSDVMTWTLGAVMMLVDVLMVGFVWMLLHRGADQRPWREWRRPSAALLGLTVLTLLAVTYVVGGVLEVLHLPDLMQSEFAQLMRNPLGVIGICLLGPVAEEVCFRQGVMGSLMRSERYGKWALWLSALLFGVIHFNPVQVVGAFLLGLLLGWLYGGTRSLVLPVVCHVVNNTLSTVLALRFGQDVQTADLWPSAGAFYASLVVVAALAVVLLRLMNHRLPRAGAPRAVSTRR